MAVIGIRLAVGKKIPIEEYWGMAMGLLACCAPVFLGAALLGWFGAFIGAIVTVLIVRKIASLAKT